MTYYALILALCLRLEVLDAKELRYVRYIDLSARLESLRDAPHIWDLGRFPCITAVVARREVWYTFRREAIEGQKLRLHHVKAYHLIELVCDRCILALDNLIDAQRTHYYVRTRRLALKYYRDAMGEEAYIQGVLP